MLCAQLDNHSSMLDGHSNLVVFLMAVQMLMAAETVARARDVVFETSKTEWPEILRLGL